MQLFLWILMRLLWLKCTICPDSWLLIILLHNESIWACELTRSWDSNYHRIITGEHIMQIKNNCSVIKKFSIISLVAIFEFMTSTFPTRGTQNTYPISIFNIISILSHGTKKKYISFMCLKCFVTWNHSNMLIRCSSHFYYY